MSHRNTSPIPTITGLALLLGGLSFAAQQEHRYNNKIFHAPIGYVITQPGDTAFDLFRAEGWSDRQIRHYGITHTPLPPRHIIAVPQFPCQSDPTNELLGASGRNVYFSRAQARHMLYGAPSE